MESGPPSWYKDPFAPLVSEGLQKVIAGCSAIVLFLLAGLFAYWAVPDVEGEETKVDVNCTNEGAYAVLGVGGVVVALAGLVLLAASVLNVRDGRSSVWFFWAVFGLAMVTCGAAAGYLALKPRPRCSATTEESGG